MNVSVEFDAIVPGPPVMHQQLGTIWARTEERASGEGTPYGCCCVGLPEVQTQAMTMTARATTVIRPARNALTNGAPQSNRPQRNRVGDRRG
jgi:hypothetical protein